MGTDQKSADAEPTALDLLRKEFGQYLNARMKHTVRKAGKRLGDATDRLAEEGHGGALPEIGSRVLKGEDPVRAVVGEKTEEVKGAVKDKAKDKAKDLLPGAGGSGSDGEVDDAKATNIIEMIDVGVPLRTAYDHWTEFDRFTEYTKGVQEAERGDDATSEWTVKIGPSTRHWTATVQEQVPDDRIVWSSEGPLGTTQGAVSFHEITPTLTRIILVLAYSPSGIVEKTGNVWRAQGRRTRLDLKLFQRYVTFAGEEAEGWRGEIRDGEIVRTHEDAMAQGQENAEDTEGGADAKENEDTKENEENEENEEGG